MQVPSRPFDERELEPWKGREAPMAASSFGRELQVVPVQDLRQLNLAWVIPFQVTTCW